MPDRVLPGPIHGAPPCVREAVCIHTNRIYDSCRDKECIEDLRIYPTRCSQEIIDKAINVKCRKAELIWTYIDVQEVSFNRGFFAVDVKFFYRITCDAFLCATRPHEVVGLATYDKRVILYGSEGSVRIFNSKYYPVGPEEKNAYSSNMPTAVVEAVDPICLGIKLIDVCDCRCGCDDLCDIPKCVSDFFSDEIVIGGDTKRLFATLGQFSIVRLERDSQLLIPCYDFCMPEKECISSSEDSPCDLFRKIKFPVEEFFPPSAQEAFGAKCDDHERDRGRKGCG